MTEVFEKLSTNVHSINRIYNIFNLEATRRMNKQISNGKKFEEYEPAIREKQKKNYQIFEIGE